MLFVLFDGYLVAYALGGLKETQEVATVGLKQRAVPLSRRDLGGGRRQPRREQLLEGSVPDLGKRGPATSFLLLDDQRQPLSSRLARARSSGPMDTTPVGGGSDDVPDSIVSLVEFVGCASSKPRRQLNR
jgi:hypothetical protein